MKDIQNLLNQIAIINKKNEEILDATGGRFNMFNVCGVRHDEVKNSAIIAEFLNPNGTHGLKFKLLECFIEMLGDKFNIKDFNPFRANVKTEHFTGDGFLDILIKDNQNKAIIIENKIYAPDQSEQLKRYDKYAKDKYKNGYQILYLTLYGGSASEQSGEGIDYLQLSYKDDIINWLEKCVSISTRYPMVRETIIQYINHLKQLTNLDMSTKNEEEITEVLSKIENLKAAKAICQNYSATFDVLAKKYFNPKMEAFAKEKGLEYYYETSDEPFIKFYLTKSDWRGKFILLFSFEQKQILYGLLNEESYIPSDESKNILLDKLKNIKYNSPNDAWTFDVFSQKLEIDNWENDIIKESNFFNDCKEKIETLLSAMEGIDF